MQNHEVTVSHERYRAQLEVQHLQKEAFQHKRQQEESQAEVQQSMNDLAMYQRRHQQLEDNVARELQQRTTEVTERIGALWRQEHQQERSRWEQECQRLRLESQSAQSYLTDHGRRDREKEVRLQQESMVLQAETAQLVREQQALMSERQTAHLAGARAREMEVHVQRQLAELGQQEQQNWQIMREECV